ncbi:hypothetical protein MMC10_008967 [Thelotrema lepadinum]|nr:hypothetical protein [Thelotrema lepadinum]
METYSAKEPAGKLKDSCDVCSAFKLRCDKQKPTCTRCANLNRPCTYSPARRAGRPHAVRREPGQNQNQKRSKAQSRSRSDSLQQCFGAPDSPNASESHLIDPTGIPGRTDSVIGFDNGCFPTTHTLSLNGDNQSADIPSSPCGFLNTRLDSDATKTDCTRVALSIVEQLETSKRWSGTASTYGADGLTVTEACQRLLTILVCPCSEQTEVALLVASACISLMDVVHGSIGATSSQGSPNLTLASHGLSEQDLLLWPRPQSSACSSSSDGQSQVGDLFKIAKVILEFTDRYCQDTKGGPRCEHTGWVVAPVAALLRSRLQSVTQGATRRLVS